MNLCSFHGIFQNCAKTSALFLFLPKINCTIIGFLLTVFCVFKGGRQITILMLMDAKPCKKANTILSLRRKGEKIGLVFFLEAVGAYRSILQLDCFLKTTNVYIIQNKLAIYFLNIFIIKFGLLSWPRLTSDADLKNWTKIDKVSLIFPP